MQIYKTQFSNEECKHEDARIQERVTSPAFGIDEDMTYCNTCQDFVVPFQVTTLEDVVDGWERQLQLFPSMEDAYELRTLYPETL